MSRHGARERIVILLARFIAGPERRHWLDAMEAELDHLPTRRLDWVLGSLVAAVKDRVARDWAFGLALVAFPTLALASTVPLTMLGSVFARTTGVGLLQLMPLMACAPLPFAFLLGAVRPRGALLPRALAGFAIYQAIPTIGFMILFGSYVTVRWEANLSAYGLNPPLGLVAALTTWCAGAWLGARWARARRGRLSPPSP